MDKNLVLIVDEQDAGSLLMLQQCLRGTPWVRALVDRRRERRDPPEGERRSPVVLECRAVVVERAPAAV